MKSAFEKSLFGVNQYSVINEENETVAIFEEYRSGKISLEEACKRVGLHEEYKKYKSGEMSEGEFSSLMEGLFGAAGRFISGVRKRWNSGVQDFRDAMMPGQLDAQTKRFNDLQRRKQLIQQYREKMRMMKEDPSQFQRTQTTSQVVGDSAKTAQDATVNASTAHAGAIQKQDIEDSRQAALRAGTDMYGNKPIEAREVEFQGMMAHDPQEVDAELDNIQKLAAQAKVEKDPNKRAALISQLRQTSAKGEELVKGAINARTYGSKGGQTTAMGWGKGNPLATNGRSLLPDNAGDPRGGRGERMGGAGGTAPAPASEEPAPSAPEEAPAAPTSTPRRRRGVNPYAEGTPEAARWQARSEAAKRGAETARRRRSAATESYVSGTRFDGRCLFESNLFCR